MESAKLESALAKSREQIAKILSATEGEANEIISVQRSCLGDPEFIGEIRTLIRECGRSAEHAVTEATDELCRFLSAMEHKTIRGRVTDFRDIAARILENITDSPSVDLSPLPPDTILIMEDLAPTQAAQLNTRNVIGIVLEQGAPTSHAAIMIRAMGIAAVFACPGSTQRIENGQIVIVNGEPGTVMIAPDAATIRQHEVTMRKKGEAKNALPAAYPKRKDGTRILVTANIGSLEEAREAKEQGADGIGLFRTELLFLNNREMPSEDDQYRIYAGAASLYGDKPTVVRTLDAGTDKPLPFLNMHPGMRGVHLCLLNPECFKTQLRALLRAATVGNLHIMFPMISSENELALSLSLLEECKNELAERKADFNPDCPVGIMIETPAAAILSHTLAKTAQFFSIGTNDLHQYTTGIDRTASVPAQFLDPLHPAVLELARKTIAAAHAANIPCSLCGDLASSSPVIPFFRNINLDEFSVPSTMIVPVRAQLLEL
jgi:phosphotransferase system enzyme I (PtsI)